MSDFSLFFKNSHIKFSTKSDGEGIVGFLKNMVNIIYIASVVLLSVTLLSGCSDSDNSYLDNSEKFYRLTEQERALYAPTQLFEAVYLNDVNVFENILSSSSFLDFGKKNIEDDTALAVAIKLQRQDFVEKLVAQATFEDLKIANSGGRSFVSLLAEYNYEKAFVTLGEKYTRQIGPLQTALANFNQLDFEDDLGRKAVHYAQTASFMDQLEIYWFWGFLDWNHPWDGFYNHTDVHGDNLLHSAAKYDKKEVVSWFVQRHCGEGDWESEEYWLPVRAVSFLFRKSGEYIQDSDFIPIRRKYVNLQNEEGNTPLHLAAINGNVRSIELLMQCLQIDPVLKNNHAQVPLTLMLKSIDPEQEVVDQNYKDAFDMLVEQVDPLWSFVPMFNFKAYVNEVDDEGFSALHYAARMRDPYFYDILEKYELPTSDGRGVLPRDRQR